MSQGIERGAAGSDAGNRLRGLRKAKGTSVISDMVSDEPKAAPEPVVHFVEPEAVELSVPAEVPVAVPPTPVVAAEPTQVDLPALEEKKRKTGIFQTPEQAARLRATFAGSRQYTGFPTMSDYAQAAIDEMNTRMEELYNQGKPFPVGPNQVRPGRPMKL